MVIYSDTVVGANSVIGDNVVLGKYPRFSKLGLNSIQKDSLSLNPLVIGEEATIGSSVILNRGSRLGKGVFIGDLALVREGCEIENNVVIGKMVGIEQGVLIGEFTKIMSCSQIAEFTKIGKSVFISADVSTCTDSSFGRKKDKEGKKISGARYISIMDKAVIGANASLGPGVVIGENSMVAMGSVVLSNVPSRKVVMGNPAKVVWDIGRELLI